jgi:hypothetical protein
MNKHTTNLREERIVAIEPVYFVYVGARTANMQNRCIIRVDQSDPVSLIHAMISSRTYFIR